MKSTPKVLAHRGASGHAPDNSLAAFREAVRLRTDGVELDLHVSASGHLIVHHDPVIPGLGWIGELELGEIRRVRLANGEPIPTLGEVLGGLGIEEWGVVGEGFEVWIELKSLPHSADHAVLEAIDGAPAALACAVHSFEPGLVARLGAQRPSLRRGILSASYPVDPVASLRATGATVLWQEHQRIDAELVGLIHGAGHEIIAWTVNDAEEAKRLAELGVDGLCGNWPERLFSGER